MFTLRMRGDLFSVNMREETNQENIKEEVSIYVCPSSNKQDIKYTKVSMMKKGHQLKVDKVSKRHVKEAVFSNDMKDACKVTCKICDKDVTMSSMSAHTRSVHCLLLKEYKDIYGDHKEKATRTFFHKCEDKLK